MSIKVLAFTQIGVPLPAPRAPRKNHPAVTAKLAVLALRAKVGNKNDSEAVLAQKLGNAALPTTKLRNRFSSVVAYMVRPRKASFIVVTV